MIEEEYTDEDKADEFGRYIHDIRLPTHSGEKGHYCLEYDGLWICKDCIEFECCNCFSEQE